MGVPKFYRWLSERYPKINQIVSDNALLPEFDHLYLDMNGIIHGCTHPPHKDVSEVLSERDMMLGIMHYLDRIITQIVKPKLSVYMAIDGVAPRAKLNQQRSRRFRSAKDLAEATKDLPKDAQGQTQAFDSNCITPGTEFLAKVSSMIQYFIRKKIKEDPLWQGLTVIFSGHDVPGEGEHKIMQHIRELKAQPGYQPNTRHCIYGQDADLIMLALVTHEPHFTILREVVNFNFGDHGSKNTLKAVKKHTKESDFQLLHLSILREYFQYEFCYQQPEYDLERIIDDFVFITFLVGNDFLPHMPTLDIGDGAFDLLFNVYKEQRTSWGRGNYLTLAGNISDAARLETFLAAIGAVETDILVQKEKDDAAYVKKRRKWDRRDGKAEGPSDAQLKAVEDEKQGDYLSMIERMMNNHSLTDADYVDGWTPVTVAGQKDFKGRYYFEKLGLKPIDKEEHWNLRRSYMEGLIWCLAYYYRGCISWGWFYPYHYGPMLSDLSDLPKMFREISFELGAPLFPFEQLMGCLPPASCALVPKPHQWLMNSPESPIIHFYPKDFKVDMNGKRNPWEGVNLLPFINVALLKETIATHCPDSKLSPAERKRNSFGNIYCYKYDTSCNETVESPGKHIGLPDIAGSLSSVSILGYQIVSEVSFQPKLVPGTQIPFPGFPSLNVVPIDYAELIHVGLNCFGSTSKYPTMILKLHAMPQLPPIEQLAESILGKSLFVNWPMMHEGRVVAMSDETKEIRLVKNKINVKVFKPEESDRWISDADIMQQVYLAGNGVVGSGGVNIGDVKVRLKLLPLQGMKTIVSTGATKKLFGREEADVPLQLALWQAPAPDPRFIERGPLTLRDRFPEGASVLLTKGKYRGCRGTVVGVVDQKNVGVKVQVVPADVPFGLAIARTVQESYLSAADTARVLRIHPGILGKVMGMLQFEQGRYDLGLNLKSGDGTCVVGYTRRKVEQAPNKGQQSGKEIKPAAWSAGDTLYVVGSAPSKGGNDDERITWEYSPKAIRLVNEYKTKFPQLFTAIGKHPNERKYDANQVFGPNGEAWLPVIREWLNNHESARLPRTPVTTESMSYDAIAAVEEAADIRTRGLKKKGYPKESLIKVPGTALYREGSTGPTEVLLASDYNNNEAPRLGDRVANLCADGVPFGARGTVVGIHEASTTGSVEVVMDEEFVGGTSLQDACSNFRGRLCLWVHLLRITPDNSDDIVDKMVPKGSGRAAVDKILSSIDRQVKSGPSGPMTSSWDGVVDTAIPATTPQRPAQPVQKMPPLQINEPTNASLQESAQLAVSAQESPSTAKPAARNNSAGRGRQGAWREARGPDEKGKGFVKGMRVGSQTGFDRWKSAVSASDSSATKEPVNSAASELGTEQKPVTRIVSSETDELKALLGVGKPAPDLDAGLKAMLGLSIVAPAEVPFSASAKSGVAASAGHPTLTSTQPVFALTEQSIRGVQVGQVATAGTAPAQQPVPLTAAAKLMQMMSAKTQIPPPVPNYQVGPPQPSRFNFTYVEQGKEPPPVPPPPTSTYSAPPLLPPGNVSFVPVQGPLFAQAMQGNFGFSPYGGIPPLQAFPPYAPGVVPTASLLPAAPAGNTPTLTSLPDQQS